MMRTMKIMLAGAFVLCLGTLFAFASDPQELVEKTGSSSFDVEIKKPPRPESGPQSGRPW